MRCQDPLQQQPSSNRILWKRAQKEKEREAYKKALTCILTELFCSNRYTGKPRKNIPAEVTFPVFALSSCTKLIDVSWNHAQTIKNIPSANYAQTITWQNHKISFWIEYIVKQQVFYSNKEETSKSKLETMKRLCKDACVLCSCIPHMHPQDANCVFYGFPLPQRAQLSYLDWSPRQYIWIWFNTATRLIQPQ
jgi:hypothetical protein